MTSCHSPSSGWALCSSQGSFLTRHQTFLRVSIPKPQASTSDWHDLQLCVLIRSFFPLSTMVLAETPSLHTPKYSHLWQRCLLHHRGQSHLRSWSCKIPALVLASKPVRIKENSQKCLKVPTVDKITEIKRQGPFVSHEVWPSAWVQ